MIKLFFLCCRLFFTNTRYFIQNAGVLIKMSGAVVCVLNKTENIRQQQILSYWEEERRGHTDNWQGRSPPAHQESSISSDNYWSNIDIVDRLCQLYIGTKYEDQHSKYWVNLTASKKNGCFL